MTSKLQKDRLLAGLANVNAILASMPDDDYIGRMGFEYQKEEIETELLDLARSPDTLANVAIVFHGKPVNGSRSISTDFAAKALSAYQELVAKRLATVEAGGLSARGPIPSKSAATLNITGVVHGSFGFVLEEDDPDSPQMINSSVREAVEKVTDVFQKFTSENDETFGTAIDEIDPRFFSSVKSFFKILNDDEATLRVVEGVHDTVFDENAVVRAHKRCQEASIGEETISKAGVLIGVLPLKRRFEFKTSDDNIIEGKIGPVFSREYLEKIEKDEQFVGRKWEAKLLRKSVERPGQATKVNFTLLDIGKSVG